MKPPFPDVRDPRPQVQLVQFEDESKATNRPCLYTAWLAPGDRIYVDLGPFGGPEHWVAGIVQPRTGFEHTTQVRRASLGQASSP